VTAEPSPLAHLRHELRTPLNHMIGYSELLLEELEDGGSQALRDPLAQIRGEARRMLEAVNEALAGPRGEAMPDLGALAARLAPTLDRILATGAALERDARRSGSERLLVDLERIGAAARGLRGLLLAPALPAAEGQGGGMGAAAAVAAGGTILVVDDNEQNRDMLARRLGRQGHPVVPAAGGREALATARSRPVDLVLLDVMMPDLDGYEVLRQLKADPALRDIPVLMISALDEMESVIRCIELGAEDYLPKPFDPVLLRARIGACLEKKRLRDQEVRHLAELAEWNQRLEERVREQVAQLERLGRLKRFFSPQLAERIVAGGAEDPLRTHRREISVVFLDLRGFTAFAESAEPEEVMDVLREYHAEMGRLILAHEGTLERFTGDGMMIFFNDPVEVPDATERAVRMAVAMRDRVRELATRWRRRGWELALGIGIAQGYATIGAIGFEGRWDYGAIGTATNLAARLCGEAKGGEILVPARVAAALEGLIEAEDAGELALKGLSRPVHTMKVLGLVPPG
jgi:class 3 adenylate cyclase